MSRKVNIISEEEKQSIIFTIKNKGKITVENPVDCETLSDDICSKTGKYISASTIKRFFGFYKSPFAPSYHTIRILKEYILMINEHKKINNDALEKLIIAFFNPIHFETIDKSNTAFQAACRTIAFHLREHPIVFENVMEPIAKSNTGRAFYYELFPDYEILPKFQYKGYEAYLKHETSYEGLLFGRCVLFLKEFLLEDFVMMKKRWEDLIQFYDKSTSVHPFVLGRYYQSRLLGSYYFNRKEKNALIKEVFQIEKIQPRNKKKLFLEFPGFHYFTCDALWHMGEYNALFELSSIALADFKIHKEFIWKGYYDQLLLYKALALVNLGKKKDAEKIMPNINPSSFYFISKNYFLQLYGELKKELI